MDKILPQGPLRIDSRFATSIEGVWKKWRGKKPTSLSEVHQIAAVAYASLAEDLTMYDWLRREFTGEPHKPFADQPRSPIEQWLRLFLRFPDFSLKVMQKARERLSTYDRLDRELWKLSAAGKLETMSDGDILKELRERGWRRGELSDSKIEARRGDWTASQNRLDASDKFA